MRMNEDNVQPEDPRLNALVRSSRPSAELRPGFRDAVWRRIEKAELPRHGMLEQMARWFLSPRLATAAVMLVMVVAGGAGALRGIQKGDRLARDRYVASVDPSYLPPRL